MVQLSEKELSALHELLAEEELLVKKFKMLEQHAEDQQMKYQMESIAE